MAGEPNGVPTQLTPEQHQWVRNFLPQSREYLPLPSGSEDKNDPADILSPEAKKADQEEKDRQEVEERNRERSEGLSEIDPPLEPDPLGNVVAAVVAVAAVRFGVGSTTAGPAVAVAGVLATAPEEVAKAGAGEGVVTGAEGLHEAWDNLHVFADIDPASLPENIQHQADLDKEQATGELAALDTSNSSGGMTGVTDDGAGYSDASSIPVPAPSAPGGPPQESTPTTDAGQPIDTQTSTPTDTGQPIDTQTSTPTDTGQPIDTQTSTPTDTGQPVDTQTSTPTDTE